MFLDDLSRLHVEAVKDADQFEVKAQGQGPHANP